MIKAIADTKVEKRREYIKNYMRGYRIREAEKVQGITLRYWERRLERERAKQEA